MTQQPQSQNDEEIARAAGWISEAEYNGEHDGVRHPLTGNWAETWAGAVAQMEAMRAAF